MDLDKRRDREEEGRTGCRPCCKCYVMVKLAVVMQESEVGLTKKKGIHKLFGATNEDYKLISVDTIM